MEDLCHEAAEDLFVGLLGGLDWSWRVVAGQNPAYDHFPCQYQLFYRRKARASFWYEPGFQVSTLDGKLIWRRRRYQVKRRNIPGTFNLSVLDNGVVTNDFWTVVDVSDDLSWGLFHYRGAAKVAGQSYIGAVLVRPNGEYPDEIEKEKLISTLEKCGIKEWEPYIVDNRSFMSNRLTALVVGGGHAVVVFPYARASLSSRFGLDHQIAEFWP
ncbi:hypothetical protein IFM89_002930 [Coptis chinensis]|uniref:VDE lipocalin domain-containing protein n=1 Tax=Coptis chinensis TaxID=261450 RepID=A0A835IH96_9MAGN|nr:hypothetical protein IFM89_002930 [Coptis chinensis]